MSTAGGELNVAYNGSLSMYSEADETIATRDRLHQTLQPSVRFFDRLAALEQVGSLSHWRCARSHVFRTRGEIIAELQRYIA